VLTAEMAISRVRSDLRAMTAMVKVYMIFLIDFFGSSSLRVLELGSSMKFYPIG